MSRRHNREAQMFKAFSDEQRLKIIEMLSEGERCACEILDELDIGQSTLSHHMKILCESGVVRGRKEGKWTYYALDAIGCERVRSLIWTKTACSDMKRAL